MSKLLTFTDMKQWDLSRLRATRRGLRDTLAREIHRRDALKAEILFLQTEIAKYQVEGDK